MGWNKSMLMAKGLDKPDKPEKPKLKPKRKETPKGVFSRTTKPKKGGREK